MTQLVGQLCVICRDRIGSDLDGQFCPSCDCPVHSECAATATAAKVEGSCPACGAPAIEVAPRREAAEAKAAWEAGSGQRRRGGCILAVGIGLIMIGLMQLAFAGNRPPPGDRHDTRGNLFNALVPVGLGVTGLLVGLRQMSRKS